MFHAFGRSLPQKTQTKSSSRTMVRSWQPGQRRKTTWWVKWGGRPSSMASSAWATAGPGDDVRAVSGRLIADLFHHPPVCLAGEADLSCAQDVFSVGACHVFAASRGQPKHAVGADHEGERFEQFPCRPLGDPVGEVGRRADPAAAVTGPDRGSQVGRADVSVAPFPCVHASQPGTPPLFTARSAVLSASVRAERPWSPWPASTAHRSSGLARPAQYSSAVMPSRTTSWYEPAKYSCWRRRPSSTKPSLR